MESENGNSALSTSMTDLMTSLAVIFILLLVASLNNAQQDGQDTRNTILRRLLERLQTEVDQYKGQGFELKNDPKDPLGLIVVVPEGLLNFEINRSEIPRPGVEFLRTIIPKMASTLCSGEFRKEMESIVIEGHTDTTGIDEINLPLSQARSLAVVQKSLEALESQDRGCFLDLLSATGRGSVEPIMGPDGKVDSARSRRVIFKIRVRSLEQRIINKVFGNGDFSGANK